MPPKPLSNPLFEIAGWYGTGAILLAYALVSYDILPSDGLLYQLLNVTGALGIIAISYKKRVFQSIALNVAWAVIGAVAIVRLLMTT